MRALILFYIQKITVVPPTVEKTLPTFELTDDSDEYPVNTEAINSSSSVSDLTSTLLPDAFSVTTTLEGVVICSMVSGFSSCEYDVSGSSMVNDARAANVNILIDFIILIPF